MPSGDPYAVMCTWRQTHAGNGPCDYAHQEFFTNLPDAHAHFAAHIREPHPAPDWEVILIHRYTGQTIQSWSTKPYEPIPPEIAALGLNAFIRSQLERIGHDK